MGLGDDLIFLGKAEEIYKQTGKKIVPVYGTGWSPMFDNVEFLSKEKTKDTITVNARDTDQPSDIHIDYYLKQKKKTIFGEQLIFRDFKPTPFKLRLTQEEEAEAEERLQSLDIKEFCVINPDYKSSFFSKNKNWGFEKYQELANRLSEHISVLRFPPPKKEYTEPPLDNTISVLNTSPRIMTAMISKARFGITFDGFMQHAMAGFKVPCVVICGGLVSEKSFGYPTNIYHEHIHYLTPCGSTYHCHHCVEANKSITVDDVWYSCLRLLNESSSSNRGL